MYALSKSLQKSGHTVRVCTTNLKDPRHNLDVPVDTPVQLDGIIVYYEPVQGSRYWGFSFPLAQQIWRQSQWADLILLHFHYQFASLVGGWISRWQYKPYVVFSHGSLNRYGISSRSRWRKELYLNLMERSNFRNALFTAYHSAEEMENSFRFGKGQVIPNGIDPQDFANLPLPDTFRSQFPATRGKRLFLYLGRLDAGKGLDLLLPAFRQLKKDEPGVHLVLVGGDEKGYEQTVRQMVRQLALEEDITLTGLIRGEQKLAALQDADIFVLPSRSEGLSIAMLEAMYMGLPVITTDRVGLWRTIERENLGWVVPLSEEELARALKQAARSHRLDEIGARAHDYVQQYHTWDGIARQLIEAIHR